MSLFICASVAGSLCQSLVGLKPERACSKAVGSWTGGLLAAFRSPLKRKLMECTEEALSVRRGSGARTVRGPGSLLRPVGQPAVRGQLAVGEFVRGHPQRLGQPGR